MTREVKTLNQISVNLDRKRVPITKKNRINGSIPYYGATGIVDYVKEYIFDEDLLLVSEDGANLLARTYPIAFSINGKTWVNNHAHVLRFKDKTSQRFVELYLNSIKLDDFVSGMAQPKLNQKMLNKIPIPFPPISEQKRIVAILDEAFESIARAKESAEKNLKNANEIFESYLQSVFENKGDGWEEKTLGELGIITSSKRIYKREYTKEGIPFYRTKEIKELSNRKDITLELFISKERYDEIKKTFGVPQIGDLLMSAVGTIGEILVIEDETKFYFKDGNIVWFKEFKSLDTNYLKFALTAFVEKLKSLAIGSAYSALTIEKLNIYKISYPKSILGQQSIVIKLDALSTETKKLEAIYTQKLADLEELKKSILAKAFKGELTEVSI